MALTLIGFDLLPSGPRKLASFLRTHICVVPILNLHLQAL